MVEVRMGDDEQVEVFDVLGAEQLHDLRVRLTGVDEHMRIARAEKERIPLADVQSGQYERRVRGRDPVAADAARHAPGEQWDEEDDERAQRGHRGSMQAQGADRKPLRQPVDDRGKEIRDAPAPQPRPARASGPVRHRTRSPQGRPS